MGLIHVPAGEDARFLPEGANQSGIAFEIHDTDFIVAGKIQILSGDVHNDSKPLSVPIVPEHKKARHETVFPEDKKKAFALGEQMVSGAWE